MHVTAIIVTYRRPQVLTMTLAAVSTQSRAPDEILVVDNDPEQSGESVALEAGATYLATGENGGPGVAFAAGIASRPTTDFYWMLDDDSTPSTEALKSFLGVFSDGVGAVSNRGGHIRFGRIRHDLANLPVGCAVEADFALTDGSVIRAKAVWAAGPPRTDFFIMMEDVEFMMRIREAGYRLLIVGDETSHGYMGASAPWRSYYQCRNLLRLALDRRSPSLLFGWVVREAATGLHLVVRRDLDRLRWRWRGTRDGLRGRMGRRHDL